MRQTDPRVSYRLYHPLPILTQHPSGGRLSAKSIHDFAERRYQKKLNDCKDFIKRDQEREQRRQQLMMRLRGKQSGGMVGPEWTWPKKGGSWQSKWYLTSGQNQARRKKLRAKCIRDISAGELGRKYLNNCKSILKTKDYLRAVRTGNEVIRQENE